MIVNNPKTLGDVLYPPGSHNSHRRVGDTVTVTIEGYVELEVTGVIYTAKFDSYDNRADFLRGCGLNVNYNF